MGINENETPTELDRYVVLLVDDDKNLLAGLVRALHNQPYSLVTARSADEAMYILKSHEVHVMVVDHKMPGTSGTEFLEWASQFYPDTKRILISGHADTDCFVNAVNKALIYRFYAKPIPVVELAIAIRTAIEDIESESNHEEKTTGASAQLEATVAPEEEK